LYATTEDLVTWMLHPYDERSRWWFIRDADVAVIDELGTRSRDSDVEYSAVKGAADAREHKPTIWISNHPPQQMRELYDDRIFSRICCGTWYELTGPDRRMA
jgi:DNA replication protein DnaC